MNDINGCGDHNCLIRPAKGAGTNGGCRCVNKNMSNEQILNTKKALSHRRQLIAKIDNAIGFLAIFCDKCFKSSCEDCPLKKAEKELEG